MNIEIPSYTPEGNKIYTIGVWLSGGADSALLCYLLAKKILQENLLLQIQPITVDYKRPFRFIAGDVVAEIKKSLPANDIFKEHLVYNPPIDTVWSPAELNDKFHQLNEKHVRENKFQVLYSGITTNPPINVQEKFNWGVLADVEIKRSNTVPKVKVRHIVRQENNIVYEFYEIKPFFDLTKQDIADLYISSGMQNTLFPITRSCEDLILTEGHCGKCWWCEERLWAFGRLK